uniref:Translocon-associated protein subunit alpha n=1 Tax=Fagus sylvatica TaxID=28930 RepID=A0A2N9G4E4_FAGSY
MLAMKNFRVFFLALLLLLASPVARCQSDSEVEATEAVDEVADLGFVGEDVQDFGDGSYSPAPGVDTISVFPKNSAKSVTAGEETDLLVGVKNDGEATLNVIAIKASIHLPCDHRLQVQNLTVQTFNNASVPASAQATFPYKFAVSKFLQAPSFMKLDQSPYQNTFYNGTIEVLEAGGPLSIESVFLVTLASALLVLLVIWIRGQIQNLSKKTKRAPKVEVGTKTTDASLDEWLQVSGLCFTMTMNFHGNCCPVDSTKGWLASVSYLLFAPRGSTIIWGPFLMKWRSQI